MTNNTTALTAPSPLLARTRVQHRAGDTLAAVSFLINPFMILSILAIIFGGLAMYNSAILRERGETEAHVGGGVVTAGVISSVLGLVLTIVVMRNLS